MQVIEGIEEFLLGALLAGEELDVVDEEDIDVAISAAELVGARVLDGGHEVIGETLRGDVKDAAVVSPGGVPDGVQEMGLP